MINRLKVGIVGGTGMVGQRFVALLKTIPGLVTSIGASANSAGKHTRKQPPQMETHNRPIPLKYYCKRRSQVEDVASDVDFIFSGRHEKMRLRLEEAYAKTGSSGIK